MERIIVSRHTAAIQFIAESLSSENTLSMVIGEDVFLLWKANGLTWARIPVFSNVTAEDVKGKIVYGNLPLSLAALAAEVIAIEFTGRPPRGQEYSLEDMKESGARLERYLVRAIHD